MVFTSGLVVELVDLSRKGEVEVRETTCVVCAQMQSDTIPADIDVGMVAGGFRKFPHGVHVSK